MPLIRSIFDETQSAFINLPPANPTQVDGIRFLPKPTSEIKTEFDRIKDEVYNALTKKIKDLVSVYEIKNLGGLT